MSLFAVFASPCKTLGPDQLGSCFTLGALSFGCPKATELIPPKITAWRINALANTFCILALKKEPMTKWQNLRLAIGNASIRDLVFLQRIGQFLENRLASTAIEWHTCRKSCRDNNRPHELEQTSKSTADEDVV